MQINSPVGKQTLSLPKNLAEAKARAADEKARQAQKQLESDPAYLASKQLAAEQKRQSAEAWANQQAKAEDDNIAKTFLAVTGALKETSTSLVAEALTQRGLEREVTLADGAHGWQRSLQTVTDPASGKLLRAELVETHPSAPGREPGSRRSSIEVTTSTFRNEDLIKGGVVLQGNRWLRKLFSVHSDVPALRYNHTISVPMTPGSGPSRYQPNAPHVLEEPGLNGQQQISVAIGSSVANREADFRYQLYDRGSYGYSTEERTIKPLPAEESARQAALAADWLIR